MTWTPNHAECLDAFLRSSLLKSNQYPMETTAILLRKSRAQSLDFHWPPRANTPAHACAPARTCVCPCTPPHTRASARARARARLRSSRIAERTKSRRINVTSGLKVREAKRELYLIHCTRVHAADPLWLVAFRDTSLRNSICFFTEMSDQNIRIINTKWEIIAPMVWSWASLVSRKD